MGFAACAAVDSMIGLRDQRTRLVSSDFAVSEPSAIISISSHVMRGTVGNRAVAFALETLGHPVWSVPTVVLPWHPGHGRSTRLVFDMGAFAGALGDLSEAKWRGEVGAILTGYFADERQVHAAASLIRRLRQEQPNLPYLCDPVIGDSGGLYVAEGVAAAIRDQLLPLATIATPNRFELGWLSGKGVGDNDAIIAAARHIGVARVVATSAHALMRGAIANLLVEQDQALLTEHPALANAPNGVGDLFAALFLSHSLAGQDKVETLRLSSASVFEIAQRSIRAGSDELLLQGGGRFVTRPDGGRDDPKPRRSGFGSTPRRSTARRRRRCGLIPVCCGC